MRQGVFSCGVESAALVLARGGAHKLSQLREGWRRTTAFAVLRCNLLAAGCFRSCAFNWLDLFPVCALVAILLSAFASITLH